MKINKIIFTPFLGRNVQVKNNNQTSQKTVLNDNVAQDTFEKSNVAMKNLINNVIENLPAVEKPIEPEEIQNPEISFSKSLYKGLYLVGLSKINDDGYLINKSYYHNNLFISKANLLAYEIFHDNGNIKQRVEIDIIASDSKHFLIEDFNKDGKKTYERQIVLKGVEENDIARISVFDPKTEKLICKIDSVPDEYVENIGKDLNEIIK